MYNLTELYGLFSDVDAGKFESLPHAYFVQQYTEFERRINVIFKDWFKLKREITDREITINAFKQIGRLANPKTKILYSFACLIFSSKRIFRSAQLFFNDGNFDYCNTEKTLLKNMAREASIFIYESSKQLKKPGFSLIGYKRRFIQSYNALCASEYYMRNFIGKGNILQLISESTAVFLIRQTIELWVKEIMELSHLEDENGEIQRLKPEYIISALKQLNGDYPFDIKVIEIVHKWTQPTIHAGWTQNLWKVEHAQHILSNILNQQIKLNNDTIESLKQLIASNFPNKRLVFIDF